MSDEYLLRDENGKVLGEVQLPKHVLFIHEMEENVVRKYFRELREARLKRGITDTDLFDRMGIQAIDEYFDEVDEK